MTSRPSCSRYAAVGFLLTAFLLTPPALAKGPMTPEQEAIYKSMMKSAGIDPGVGMDALKQNEASKQWTDSKGGVVEYSVVGVFQGRTDVVGDPNWIGYADVTDRVEIQLKWSLTESKPVGTPSFQNTKSEAKNLRNWEPACQPPVLKGDYEHFDLQAVRAGLGGALELQVQTSYPVAEVVQSCSGSRKSTPASRSSRTEELVVPSPTAFGMKLPDSDNLRVSADKKSLIHKKGGWTWTFTPVARK